jgi:hypothetical protein
MRFAIFFSMLVFSVSAQPGMLCEGDVSSTCWDCEAYDISYQPDTQFILWDAEDAPNPIPYHDNPFGAHTHCPFWMGIGWSRMFWVRATVRNDSNQSVTATAVGYINCPGGTYTSLPKIEESTMARAFE